MLLSYKTTFLKTKTNSFLLLIITFLLTILDCSGLEAQLVVDKPLDSTQIKEYAKRVRMPRIDGKYIPIDLADALKELDKIMDPKALATFKAMSEDDARRKTHYNFGRFLMLRWGMVDGSRLTEWFRQNKIFNVDDMVDCVITTYHRKINGLPLQFEELAKYYYKKQQKRTEELLEKQKQMQKKQEITKDKPR